MNQFLIACVMLVGCQGAYRPGDTPDAGMCTESACASPEPASCVDEDTLRVESVACEIDECAYSTADVECGELGCCGDHCCAVRPSNSTDVGELMPTGSEVELLAGEFDTTADCRPGATLGDCTIVERAGLPDACVCRADRIRIGDVRIRGLRALVLLAHREVLVTGTLDLSGHGELDGPGAGPTCGQDSSRFAGGTGGSFGSIGGDGGAVNAPPVAGTPTLTPLVGGMSGCDSGGFGGGGGGALQITAGQRIEVVTAIVAGGGGGRGGSSTGGIFGGGGGGSGGAILLEAPRVVVAGALRSHGGGGGGGGSANGSGADGVDGVASSPAMGGVGRPVCTSATSNGGSGATGTTAAMDGDDACGISNGPFAGGGGGGGGVGRIRINSSAPCQCSNAISPTASFGSVGVH